MYKTVCLMAMLLTLLSGCMTRPRHVQEYAEHFEFIGNSRYASSEIRPKEQYHLLERWRLPDAFMKQARVTALLDIGCNGRVTAVRITEINDEKYAPVFVEGLSKLHFYHVFPKTPGHTSASISTPPLSSSDIHPPPRMPVVSSDTLPAPVKDYRVVVTFKYYDYIDKPNLWK